MDTIKHCCFEHAHPVCYCGVISKRCVSFNGAAETLSTAKDCRCHLPSSSAAFHLISQRSMPGKSPQKEVGSSCTTGYLSHGFEFHLSDQDSGVYDYELLYLMVALNA
jgi:hypothetical protein